MESKDLVFVGFNKRAAALDRRSGQIVWKWRASQGSGYVSLLLDREFLFAAVNGYTYCLDPRTGEELWQNPMNGFGHGVTSMATVSGHTDHGVLQEVARAAAAAAAAS